MLRKVILAPRHFLEHFVADLACNTSTPSLLSLHSRWHAVAATSLQHTVSHYARPREENCVEKNTMLRDPSAPFTQTPVQHDDTSSPHLETVGQFLRHYGRSTNSALRYMRSDPTVFSRIHSILQSEVRLYGVSKRFASSDVPVRSVDLLKLAAVCGCTLDAKRYETICWELAKSPHLSRWKYILEIYNIVQGYLGTPTLRLFNWRVRAICETQHFASLDSILQEFRDAGVTPSRESYHWILTGHLRNRNLAGARLCLSLMKDAGIPPDATTHSVIALNYRPLGLDAQVEHLAIESLHSLPQNIAIRVVNQLMQDHLDFKDEAGFRRLLLLFDKSAVAPIWGLLHERDPDRAQPSKLSRPLLPNLTTFLIAIRLFISRSEFSSAMRLFRHLRRQGRRCTPGILAAYLDLQFAANRPDYALSASAGAMAKQQIVLDQLLQLSQGRCRYGNHRDRNLPFLGRRGVQPRVDIFNALLRGSLKAWGLDTAHIILEMMDQTSVRPDSQTMEIIISHLISVEGASISKALQILREVSSHVHPTLRLSYAVLNRNLDELKRKTSSVGWNRDKYMSQKKSTSNFQDPVGNLRGPLAGLESTMPLNRQESFNDYVQSLTSRNFQSDSSILGMRIRYEALVRRDMTAASAVYSDMLSRGLTPSEYHIAALMEGFVYQGDMDKALELMQAARDLIIKPNVVMYTIVLHGYARRRKPKSAIQLFRRMIADGIRPDVPAIDALCSALFNAGNRWLAKKLLASFWSYIQPFPREHKSLPLKQLVEAFRRINPSKFVGKLSMKERVRLDWILSRIMMAFKRCFERRGR